MNDFITEEDPVVKEVLERLENKPKVWAFSGVPTMWSQNVGRKIYQGLGIGNPAVLTQKPKSGWEKLKTTLNKAIKIK